MDNIESGIAGRAALAEKQGIIGNVPKPTSELEMCISQIGDAISRIGGLRQRLGNRNDQLFGQIPQTDSKEGISEKPAGAIFELRGLFEILHQNISFLESEVDRQEPLI